MPPMEKRHRKQKAVLWPILGVDEFNEPTYDDPVELNVRWTWKNMQAVSPTGSPMALDAQVVVGEVVYIGSLMWEGTLADWYGTGSAGDDDAVMYVVTSNETADLKNRPNHRRRTLGLSRFKDAVPPG